MKYMIFTANVPTKMSENQIDQHFRKKNSITENAKLFTTKCEKSQYCKNEYVICAHYQENH